MINCKKCSTQNEEDSSFCKNCGNPLKAEDATMTVPKSEIQEPDGNTGPKNGEIFCRNCGKSLEAGAYACTGCGLPPYKGKSYCQHCGAATNPQAVICIKCGSKLTNMAPVSIKSIDLKKWAGDNDLLSQFKGSDATKQIGFWGALISFIGFFLPWVSFWFMSGNGYTIATRYLDKIAFERILLLAIPIICILFIINLLRNVQYAYFKIIKYVPLILLVLSLLITLIKLGNASDNVFHDVFRIIGAGYYISLIGAIMMCYIKTE